MAFGNLLSDGAVATLRKLIREENAKYRNERPLRARWFPRRGGGGSSTVPAADQGCSCGSCIDAGAVTACGSISGNAATNYKFTTTDVVLRSVFGTEVVLTHSSSCTWESDTFTADLGDGSHDYTWKLVFAGEGVEEATLTLEDET